MKRIGIISLFGFIFFVVFGPAPFLRAAEETAKPVEGMGTKVCELKIEGMTCGMCEAKVKEAVKDLALSAEIDSKTGMGKVAFTEGKTTCDELAWKVSGTGFKATVVK